MEKDKELPEGAEKHVSILEANEISFVLNSDGKLERFSEVPVELLELAVTFSNYLKSGKTPQEFCEDYSSDLIDYKLIQYSSMGSYTFWSLNEKVNILTIN